MNKLAPAFLFTGNTQETKEAALNFIQKQICKNGGCKECSLCKQISEGTHHSFVSIIPEKRYTRETLEPIFIRTACTLDEDTHCFFIIHKADTLSLTCANSLLKIVEEPPAGYHFIFLAQRLQQVLPTIRSRCIIRSCRGMQTHSTNVFLKHFTGSSPDPLAFQKDLLTLTLTEEESEELTDYLFFFWTNVYKQALKERSQDLQKQSTEMINLLKNALLFPPAPGGSKLFWKNLYLQHLK